MNGPPTPPSSNEELGPAGSPPSPPVSGEGEGETTPPGPPTTAQPPAPIEPLQQQSPYYALFSQIAEVEATGDHVRLAQIAEAADLTATHDSHPTRLLITASIVLSYLILDDLPPAKSALLRLPNSLAAQQLPQALFSLLSATWLRRYENIYRRTDEIIMFVQGSGVSNSEGNAAIVLARLVTTFIDTFRARTFALVSKAYTSIPLALAQTYLGLGREQLLAGMISLN
ncbi:hypothetical protein FA95DRAFT_13646 [Auriscalpium vulgare]|uniref:Uncharacterized protein n=1 Tax=Auriscalpium vulgare TaxID=40419 RepID=A0ACB8SCM3_9AGAM|nr:hypothetical protein FA95DRAFT_13646 [Auriscalpium vulgare]